MEFRRVLFRSTSLMARRCRLDIDPLRRDLKLSFGHDIAVIRRREQRLNVRLATWRDCGVSLRHSGALALQAIPDSSYREDPCGTGFRVHALSAGPAMTRGKRRASADVGRMHAGLADGDAAALAAHHQLVERAE